MTLSRKNGFHGLCGLNKVLRKLRHRYDSEKRRRRRPWTAW